MQNTPRMTRLQTLAADYVCWVDYLPEWVYRYVYLRVPGAYRLYKLAERKQH